MRHRTLLISIVLMLAVLTVACEAAAAEKPTAEPPTPTPVPTVTPEVEETGASLSIREALADPTVLECISEELGASFDLESGAVGPELLGRLGGGEFELLAECGVDVSEGFGLATGAAVFDDPAVRECLAGELGEDIDPRTLQRALFSGGLSEELALAFDTCGIDPETTLGGRGGFGGGGFLGGGGRRGGGGFPLNEAVLECMNSALGPDALAMLANPDSPPTAEQLDLMEQCGGLLAIPVEPDGGIGDGAGPIPVEPSVEPTATPIPVSELTIAQLTCLAGALEPAALASVVIATSSGDISELADDALAALVACGVES